MATWDPDQLWQAEHAHSRDTALRAAMCAGLVRMPRLAPRAGLDVPAQLVTALDVLFSPQHWARGEFLGVQDIAAMFA